MKAVISDRIYLKIEDLEFRAELEKELTYVFYQKGATGVKPIKYFGFKWVTKDIVSIPSGRTDLIPDTYEIVDKRVKDEVDFPEFKFELRPDQKEVYDELGASSIINAAPSWGKFCPPTR